MHLDTRLPESRRNRSRYVLILGRQDAWAALEESDSRAKCVENRGDCTPVAPAPTTSIDGGTEVRPQASLWVLVNSKPGTGSRRLVPPVQTMIFLA
jgi:hypothetical protein